MGPSLCLQHLACIRCSDLSSQDENKPSYSSLIPHGFLTKSYARKSSQVGSKLRACLMICKYHNPPTKKTFFDKSWIGEWGLRPRAKMEVPSPCCLKSRMAGTTEPSPVHLPNQLQGPGWPACITHPVVGTESGPERELGSAGCALWQRNWEEGCVHRCRTCRGVVGPPDCKHGPMITLGSDRWKELVSLSLGGNH